MVLKISNTDGVWIDIITDSDISIFDYNELIHTRKLAVFYSHGINFRRFKKLGFHEM